MCQPMGTTSLLFTRLRGLKYNQYTLIMVVVAVLLQEYEMELIEGQCCGRCVKTKCKFNGAMYAVGETWKSPDDCVMFECIKGVSELFDPTSYKTKVICFVIIIQKHRLTVTFSSIIWTDIVLLPLVASSRLYLSHGIFRTTSLWL